MSKKQKQSQGKQTDKDLDLEQESRAEQLEDQLKRVLADYQNLERRVNEERRLLGQLSTALVIEKFLPVLDNLENAQNHLQDQGLEMVLKQFKEILASEGVEEIEAEGQIFDPHLHEATEVQEGKKDGVIVKVNTKGYKIEDRVLRPAKVTVERAHQENLLQDEGPKEETIVN